MSNERPETKREKFERLRDARVPKVIHALGLLENLGGSGYESSEAVRRAVIAELQAAVDGVAAAFGLAQAETQPEPVAEPEPQPVEDAPKPKKRTAEKANDGDTAYPTDVADGGAIAKHEINWAFDAVRRKDWKLAENRLKRIIDAWK